MSLLLIIQFLKNSWPIWVGALVLAAVFAWGRSAGVDAEHGRCEAILQKQRDADQAMKDNMQRAADDAAQSYQKYLSKQNAAFQDLNERLEDEKKRNAAYGSCRAGSSFLRLYERATAPSIGEASGQPDR